MAAQGKILNLSPNFIGDPAAIDAQQKELVGNVQKFGADQTNNISNIYGQQGLQGQLGQNATSIQGTYDQGNRNLNDAYSQAGAQGSSDLSSILAQLRSTGGNIGAGNDAINAVIAGAGSDAVKYSQRNTHALTERLAGNAQLGTNMTALAKMGIAAAAKAEAQGKRDLSDRIIQQVQSLGTAANMGKAGYYNREAQKQEKESAKAMAEVMRAQHEAAADARANASSARADARAARSGGGSKTDPFALADYKAAISDRQYGARHPGPDDNFDNVLGPGAASEAASAIYRGMDPDTVFKTIRTPGRRELNRDVVMGAAMRRR